MKKALSLVAVAPIVASLAGCGGSLETGVLTVGLECAYAPFNWTATTTSDTSVTIANSGFLGIGASLCDGYDVQVAQHIADELGYELRIRQISWDGLIPALEAGTIDAIIAGMTDTPERRESVSFTAPYYASELVMLVRQDGSFVDATAIADFAGANLAAQLGTVQQDLLDDLAGDNGYTVNTPYETYPAALQALLTESVGLDGVLAERPIAEEMLAAYPDDLSLVEFYVDETTYDPDWLITVSVALRQSDTDLLADMDEVLADLSEATRLEWMEAAIAAPKA